MNKEIAATLNLIDTQADRILECSLHSNDRDLAKILEDYANSLFQLSTETWKKLGKIKVYGAASQPLQLPERHPELRSLSEADQESLNRR